MGAQVNIRRLFEAERVAVIGASSKPGKIGHTLVENLLDGGYRGEILPVNPAGGQILGLPVLRNLSEADAGVDLVTVAVPKKKVMLAVDQAARNGAGFLSVITSGFSEVGDLAAEHELVSQAHAAGMRVLGPNIFGVYSAKAKMNATFGPKGVAAGSVAIISQSGALGIALMGKTKDQNIGLSAFVSVGNKADLEEADLLEYLMDQEETKAIMMYLEGVRDGQRLYQALARATEKKPVVVIKSGRSKRGAMAAASHTGSLAGEDKVFDDLMRQCGVLRAEGVQQALDWCRYISGNPPPTGSNCVIITNGGGIGVLASDVCESYGLSLEEDSVSLEKLFRPVVPSFGSTKNPVDLTGGADLECYERALDIALERDEVGSVLCLGCETGLLDQSRLVEALKRMHVKSLNRKPVSFCFFGGSQVEAALHSLRRDNVPVFGDVDPAVSCLATHYRVWRRHGSERTGPEEDKVDRGAIAKIVEQALSEGRSFLPAAAATAFAKAAGFRPPRNTLVRNGKDAVEAARSIGYPVVIKVVSEDILHKSDAGGVAVNLENDQEVETAVEVIRQRCLAFLPEARISAFEVVEMVPRGTEVILGARRDQVFGPIAMFGLGGIYVEILKDVVFRALPLSKTDAFSMIRQIHAYSLLLGVRGEAPRDLEVLADQLVRVSQALVVHPAISDIEVNPLFVYEEGKGACAVDVRVLISPLVPRRPQ